MPPLEEVEHELGVTGGQRRKAVRERDERTRGFAASSSAGSYMSAFARSMSPRSIAAHASAIVCSNRWRRRCTQ
jgi:hypothetical protein